MGQAATDRRAFRALRERGLRRIARCVNPFTIRRGVDSIGLSNHTAAESDALRRRDKETIMDFANLDWTGADDYDAMPFAADSFAGRSQMALHASADLGGADFEACATRHTRACEMAIASLFDGAL